MLKILKTPETEFSRKVKKNVKLCQKIWKQSLQSWMTTHAQKSQNFVFKDEEYDCRCSNYPFRHAKTFHSAERKDFTYGAWTRCFFDKL